LIFFVFLIIIIKLYYFNIFLNKKYFLKKPLPTTVFSHVRRGLKIRGILSLYIRVLVFWFPLPIFDKLIIQNKIKEIDVFIETFFIGCACVFSKKPCIHVGKMIINDKKNIFIYQKLWNNLSLICQLLDSI
jgi:hypothetical protein